MIPRSSSVLLAAALSSAALSPLAVDTFGTGTNQFSIDFVTVGAAANPADTNGYGAVPYEFRIGTH